MTNVMMQLGNVVFSVAKNTYESIARTYAYNWKSSERINNYPAYQFSGIGEATISLSGSIYPGQFGSVAQLQEIESAANRGEVMPMFSGYGDSLGAWIVTSFSQNDEHLTDTGRAQKISFTINLSRFSDLETFMNND